MNSVFVIRNKETRRVVFGKQNAYTTKGRGEAALRQKFGSRADDYEVVEFVAKDEREVNE